jgi:hypothetical protein
VSISQPDSASIGIASSITANNACAIGDLIVSQFQLNNVSAGNSAFTPTISDTVNSGNYTVAFTHYYATTTNIYGYAYLVANAAGTPVVSVTPNAAFSGGQFSYIRFAGFTATPALDPASTNTSGAANPITGSMTTGGVNEAVVQLIWNTGGGNVPSLPGGWTEIFNAGGASLVDPFWLENVSPGSVSFSANGSVSAQWFSATVGFSSGAFSGVLTANNASFSLTGNATSFVLSQQSPVNLLANPGAFDLIGAQAQSQFLFPPGRGSYTWTGNAATFTNSTGTALTLTASQGAFVMTGQAAILQTVAYMITAFTGSFNLAGQTVNFQISGIAPPGFEFVPNLVGLDWLTASAVLYFGGFSEISPSIVKGTAQQQQEGLVVGQTPSAFTEVQQGCAVQLSVASSNLLSVSFEAL